MDASKTDWGAVCQGSTTGVNLVISGKDKTYQYTGAHCIKTCNIDLYQGKSVTAIHLQIGNMTALSYLVKMEGSRSPELLQVAKEIWDYLLAYGIAVTAEYLPSSLNIQADWQCRNHRDSSDWK